MLTLSETAVEEQNLHILLILRLEGLDMQLQERGRMGNRCTQKVLGFLGRLEKDTVLDFLEEKFKKGETLKWKLINIS